MIALCQRATLRFALAILVTSVGITVFAESPGENANTIDRTEQKIAVLTQQLQTAVNAALNDARRRMADDPATLRNLAARGLRPLDFDRAIDLLIDTSAGTPSDRRSAVVLDADFGKLLGSMPQPPSLLRALYAESTESGGTATTRWRGPIS